MIAQYNFDVAEWEKRRWAHKTLLRVGIDYSKPGKTRRRHNIKLDLLGNSIKNLTMSSQSRTTQAPNNSKSRLNLAAGRIFIISVA